MLATDTAEAPKANKPRTESLQKIWGALKGSVTIVVPEYVSVSLADLSTGLGELKGLIYSSSILYSLLSADQISLVPCPVNKKIETSRLGDNLLVLGGRNANGLAGELMQDPAIKTSAESAQNSNLRDAYSVDDDSGTLAFRKASFRGKDRNIWIFNGTGTFGTYAAVIAAFSEEFCKAVLDAKKTDRYEVTATATNIKNGLAGIGEIEIRTEAGDGIRAVGPIYNQKNLNAVMTGVKKSQEAKAMFPWAVAAFAVVFAMGATVFVRLFCQAFGWF